MAGSRAGESRKKPERRSSSRPAKEPGGLLHIKRARILDAGSDRAGDLILEHGRIVKIGRGLATPARAQVIDAQDRLVVPGLIDLHTHLREPGQEYKEDLRSGSAAAAAGGFTAVCAMPNTVPPNDTRAVTALIRSRAEAIGGVHVYPIGCISRDLKGEALADIGELKEAGAVAISDDGRPVMNSGLMRRALEYGRTFGLPVIQHAEDLNLSESAPMNEGASSTRAGLRGQPSQAEEVIVARDLALVELTGARYHVAHISTAGSVQLVRDAKRRGLPVTCEVTPHHLVLTEQACLNYDTSTKVNPPLRTPRDVEALREALADGTIDAIATDHAPHSSLQKLVEFDQAAPGMLGLETALAVVLKLVKEGALTLHAAIERMTRGPARTLNLPGGAIAEGAPADVTCIDLDREWTVDPERFKSKSRNTPFAGWEMAGKAVLTIVSGKVVFDER